MHHRNGWLHFGLGNSHTQHKHDDLTSEASRDSCDTLASVRDASSVSGTLTPVRQSMEATASSVKSVPSTPYPALNVVNPGCHPRVPGTPIRWQSLLLALCSLTFVVGMFHWHVTLIVACFLTSGTASKVLAALLAALLPLALRDWVPCPCPSLILGRMMQSWREYFSVTFLSEHDFSSTDQNYIVAAFPHGAFPLSAILSSRFMPLLFPRRDTRVLAASVLFHIPIARQFYRCLGASPATRPDLYAHLQRGFNVGILVGGIAEMFMLHADYEQVCLRKRSGFIRAALATGSDIVPSYHFGASLTTRFGPPWLRSLSRRVRASVGVVYGRWGLPVPFPTRLHVVYGAPVRTHGPLPRSSPDFEARVLALKTEFEAALVGLYDRHKAEYGWGDRPLVVS